jgi:hypothetical protein
MQLASSRNYFMPLRLTSTEATPNPDLGAPTGIKKSERTPPPIIPKPSVNFHPFQKDMKLHLSSQFSLWAMRAGICIITYSMANYKIMLSYLANLNFHYFTKAQKACQGSYTASSFKHFLKGYHSYPSRVGL